MKPDSILTMARRLLALHGKPYDNDTNDADNAEFERMALELARAVVQQAEYKRIHRR
jgi:hypothetical protein